VALQGGSGSGDSSSIIKGGGMELSRTEGQIRKGEMKPTQSLLAKPATAEFERQEKIKLMDLKHRIEAAIERNPNLSKYRNQLLLDLTSEGLRVQIVDEKNRPMFAIGRAELQPYARDILVEIGRTLNNVENKVSLAGHTDATAYASGERGYSNWELSADRANACPGPPPVARGISWCPSPAAPGPRRAGRPAIGRWWGAVCPSGGQYPSR
jgi:chemotaxis protein MotB